MLRQIVDGIKGTSLNGLSLLLRNPSAGKSYVSECLRRHDELIGRGLPVRDPLADLPEGGSGWLMVPALLKDGGGLMVQELVYLAAIAQRLQPRKTFEIGTYNGRTTATFIRNIAPDAEVITMDLPDGDTPEAARNIPSDIELISHGGKGSFALQDGLKDRFQQIRCDSMDFDPTPHAGTVELAFIDGAHARAYVQNDTEKVALMMAERGIVLWHDYGGKGSFRPLAEYLEELGRQAPIYRIEHTSLAWAKAESLRRACGL